VGYFGYPVCEPCQCHINGTLDQVCDAGGGQCPCKPNFDGFNCDQCAYGYYDFPRCTCQLCYLLHLFHLITAVVRCSRVRRQNITVDDVVMATESV